MAGNSSQAEGARTKRWWGFWATLGFSAVVLAAFFAIQTGVTLALVAWGGYPSDDTAMALESASSNGFLLAIATLISTPICTALVVLFARLRRGAPIREYLGLTAPTRRQIWGWILATAALVASSDALGYVLDRPAVPAWMVETYRTAVFAPAFFIAIVIVAPVFEEVFFRGFLFQGIRRSRLGAIGALGITSFLWAIIHLQYDAFDIGQIFILGLLLGVARLSTGSTHLTMAMHCLANVWATVEVLLYVHVLG